MTTCVPVLFGKTYSAKRIVEFMELNLLQGIEKVFLYYSPSVIQKNSTLQKTLKYYADNHTLQLIKYDAPFSDRDIWYHGQLIAITDCLLKNTQLSKFTFFNDIDEFFVPRSKDLNLFQTIKKLFEEPLVGSQQIAVKYINTKDTNPPITLKNVVSEKRSELRFTKCVIRPEMVFEQGIHHTSRVIQDNYKTNKHDGSLLQVYHFKPSTYCCQQELGIRNRYSEQLQNQFDYVVKFLGL